MQQPPGYQPQGPQGGPQYQQGGQQQPQGGHQYQQPGPQYGQMPYYPPQKKGMPGWAWGLIIGAIVLFCGFPLLGLALIPLITTNTSEARRAEAEQMMGSLRGQARIAYSKTATAPTRLTGPVDLGGCNVSPPELEGMYFRIDDSIRPGTRAEARMTANPKSPGDGVGTHEFDWATGNGTYTWQ